MAYFKAPHRDAERMLHRLEHMQRDLYTGWRDPSGRRFVKDSVEPTVDRAKQILVSIHALEDLERRVARL